MFSFAKKLKDKLEGGAGPAGSAHGKDSYFQSNLKINNGGYGLRVLYVAPGSAALDLGFEAWFDYIVGVNGHDLPMKYPQNAASSYTISEDGSFSYGPDSSRATKAGMVDFDLLAQELSMVASSPNKTASFQVWSAKGGCMRHVSFELKAHVENTPSEPLKNQNSFRLYSNVFAELGLTLSSQHLNTATHVWKILTSHQHSPAFEAQLVPFSDYIIGCDSAFTTDENGKCLLAGGGEQLLGKVVSSYYSRHHEASKQDRIPIVLYIYNHDFDTVRPVTVHLSRAWAHETNKGILGCDVGYGFLHRLPEVPGKYPTLAPQNLTGVSTPSFLQPDDSGASAAKNSQPSGAGGLVTQSSINQDAPAQPADFFSNLKGESTDPFSKTANPAGTPFSNTNPTLIGHPSSQTKSENTVKAPSKSKLSSRYAPVSVAQPAAQPAAQPVTNTKSASETANLEVMDTTQNVSNIDSRSNESYVMSPSIQSPLEKQAKNKPVVSSVPEPDFFETLFGSRETDKEHTDVELYNFENSRNDRKSEEVKEAFFKEAGEAKHEISTENNFDETTGTPKEQSNNGSIEAQYENRGGDILSDYVETQGKDKAQDEPKKPSEIEPEGREEEGREETGRDKEDLPVTKDLASGKESDVLNKEQSDFFTDIDLGEKPVQGNHSEPPISCLTKTENSQDPFVESQKIDPFHSSSKGPEDSRTPKPVPEIGHKETLVESHEEIKAKEQDPIAFDEEFLPDTPVLHQIEQPDLIEQPKETEKFETSEQTTELGEAEEIERTEKAPSQGTSVLDTRASQKSSIARPGSEENFVTPEEPNPLSLRSDTPKIADFEPSDKIEESSSKLTVPSSSQIDSTDSRTPKLAEISKIDSLLDEDEDFLEPTEEEVSGAEMTSNSVEKSAQEPATSEISLAEPKLMDSPIIDRMTEPSSPLVPKPAPGINVFSPMKSTTPQTSLVAPPASKPGRRRKPHGPGNVGSLADFMNEELSKSKANDINYNAGTNTSSDGLPPPPPKSTKH